MATALCGSFHSLTRLIAVSPPRNRLQVPLPAWNSPPLPYETTSRISSSKNQQLGNSSSENGSHFVVATSHSNTAYHRRPQEIQRAHAQHREVHHFDTFLRHAYLALRSLWRRCEQIRYHEQILRQIGPCRKGTGQVSLIHHLAAALGRGVAEWTRHHCFDFLTFDSLLLHFSPCMGTCLPPINFALYFEKPPSCSLRPQTSASAFSPALLHQNRSSKDI